jgi:16S rRNA (guanine966-N2)-methyltransferase
LRIIGGSLRGRRLVDWEESGIRPVRDKVRSALFSIVSDFVPGAVCLDLFAGTGSLGLEALSRGARSCLFVDDTAAACALIRRNLDALDLLKRGEVHEGDVLAAVEHYARRGRRFDVVFIDPPYFHELAGKALKAIARLDALGDDPVVVVASHKHESLPDVQAPLALVDRRRYGDNLLWFYRRDEGEPVDSAPTEG